MNNISADLHGSAFFCFDIPYFSPAGFPVNLPAGRQVAVGATHGKNNKRYNPDGVPRAVGYEIEH